VVVTEPFRVQPAKEWGKKAVRSAATAGIQQQSRPARRKRVAARLGKKTHLLIRLPRRQQSFYEALRNARRSPFSGVLPDG
jgi:hypothetical protein